MTIYRPRLRFDAEVFSDGWIDCYLVLVMVCYCTDVLFLLCVFFQFVNEADFW